MSRRAVVGVWQIIILVLAAMPAFGDDPPTLVKVRLKGGRAVVGELIDQSREQVKLRDLKSGKEIAYSPDDLLKVERDVADSDAIASVGLPAFVAWRLSREKVGASAGKIADVKPTAIYLTIGTKAGVEKGQKLTVYRGEGEVKDPDTGAVLERQRAKIAEIEITEAREKFSKAKLLGDLEVQLRVGDEVETDQSGTAIAVLPPVDEDGNRTTGGEKLAEELTTALVTHGIKVVERTLLEKALAELELQQERAFDEASVRNVGKQLGARAIMTGRLVQTGRLIDMHIRLIKVDTGEIVLAASQKKSGDVGDVVDDANGRAERGAANDEKDQRDRWLNETYKLTLRYVRSKKVWEEVDDKTNRVLWVDRETGRTDDYVELFSPDRKYQIRLRENRMELKKDGRWEWVANGHWASSSPRGK